MISTLIDRFSALHDNHRRIAGGALAIGLLTLIAKLFVAAREMAIAWRYGISATVDSYQLAITITTWLPTLVNGVMTVVLVPRLVGIRAKGPDRTRFMKELNGSIVLLAIAISAFTWVIGPLAASLLAGDRADIRRLTASISAQIAPVSLFVILCGYLSARMQSRERFTYSVSEAVPAVTIALFLALPFGARSVVPLIAGSLTGYLLQVVVLGRMTERADPPLGGLALRHESAEWDGLYGALGMMAFGQLLLAFTNPIDQAFAARLGPGAVATLGYANRVVSLLTTFGAVVVARALLPVLSNESAQGRQRIGRRHTIQWSVLMGTVAAVGTAAMWAVAPVVVKILFERGAFDPAASASVTHVLRFGLVQVPFYFSGLVLVQWYAATSRYGAIIGITACALVAKVALNAVLAPRLGVAGIALATGAMYFLTASLLVAGVRNEPKTVSLHDRRGGLP